MSEALKSSKVCRIDRKKVAEKLAAYEQKRRALSSQRIASKELDVARETLRYWHERKESIPLSASVVECFESPDGCEFLQRLVSALQFVMTEIGSCGLRLVSLVLELSHLHHFVGSSYETLRQRGVIMENEIIAFGQQEQKRLSADMPCKKISVAQDETFHPQACLVAIEPVSNFILLEQYSEKRDAASWNKAMDAAVADLNVEVIQSVSDEAKGIVNHVEQHLSAQHCPDIFHVQYEIMKASSAALAAKERQAEKSLSQAQENIAVYHKCRNAPTKPKGRQAAVVMQNIETLEKLKDEAQKTLEECTKQKEAVLVSKKTIGRCYHPYDLGTGNAVTTEVLEGSLNQCFSDIEKNVEAAKLRDSAMKKIAKAKRTVPKLVETLAFYWSLIQVMLNTLALSSEGESLMKDILIAIAYIRIASNKASASDKAKLTITVTELIKKRDACPYWQSLDEKQQQYLQHIADEYAGYFQRSSSCVEGRNGYLSFRHHSLHHISKRKLNALTIIHNYFIKRHDNTTAGERFFNRKPHDLFEHLLEKMPYPGRSGKRAGALKQAA